MTDAKREKCPMCAEDVEPGAKFCPHCGTQFQVSRSGYCSACLDVVEVGINDKCSRCGGDLADIHRVRKPVESVGVPARLAPAGGGPPPAPGTSALVPGKARGDGPERWTVFGTARLFGILGVTFVVAVMAIAGSLWDNRVVFVIWQLSLWTGLALFLFSAFSKARLFFLITVPVTVLILVLFIVGGVKGDIGWLWWLISPCILAIACSVMGVIMGENKRGRDLLI